MSMWTEWFRGAALRRELKLENEQFFINPPKRGTLSITDTCFALYITLDTLGSSSLDLSTTEADTEEKGGGGGRIRAVGNERGGENERKNH